MRLRRTGAAAKAFGVKTAAAAAGRRPSGPRVVAMTARSGRPDALIPTAVAPATNPPGIAARRSTAGRTGGGADDAGAGSGPAAEVAVMVVWLRRQRQLLEAGGLRQPMDDVEGLYRLAGGALDEVVDDPEGEDSARPCVVPDVDAREVAAGDVLRRRGIGHDLDERLVRVGRRIQVVELFLRDVAGRSDVAGREDAAGHRDEVREEVDRGGPGIRHARRCPERRELLLDLGDVPVPCDAVRADVLVDGPVHELGLRLTTGATHAALRVDDEVADEPGAGEGRERQERRRRIAAGRPDDGSAPLLAGGQLGAMELGQAVHGARAEAG